MSQTFVNLDVQELTGTNHRADNFFKKVTVTNVTTAGNATYTAASLLGGFITRDPAGGARDDVTPTAALIIKAMGPNVKVGDSFEFTIRNTADASETITVTAGTDVTLSGTMTIAQNASRRFLAVVTSVSSLTVTLYSNGAFTH